MRILLVEDDLMFGEALSQALTAAAHAVDWVHDGVAASSHWQAAPYDLVLLDLGLPQRDGLKVLEEGRRKGLDTPVLVITARDEVQARIIGLDTGADDYLVKPFDLDELFARIRALARRRAGRTDPSVEHLGLKLDFGSREAHFHGQPISFTRREFALLSALIEQPGRVWTREALVERLYGWDSEIASNVVEVQIHALRRKLSPEYIGNARGVGYFVPKA